MTIVYVYLLHFHERYPNGRRPQHYLGVAKDLHHRMKEHQRGSTKSRLTRACVKIGLPMVLARTWKFRYPKAAFDRERRMKGAKKGYAHLCPVCRQKVEVTQCLQLSA